MQYTKEMLFCLAKRENNTKRNYLLVNPLQGKHIPVSPTVSWNMMLSLGNQLKNQYPNTRLVIGFAETATAVGAAVASCFGEDCIYIHTTREELLGVKAWVEFKEEHSHAIEQKLCEDHLAAWIEQTPQIIFVDDELSTGKTMINIVTQLSKKFPILEEKKMVAASIINRLTSENLELLSQHGIQTECLLKLENEDYTKEVNRYTTAPAMKIEEGSQMAAKINEIRVGTLLLNPRVGVFIEEYLKNCNMIANEILSALKGKMKEHSKVLVLGTEECMYPAMALGKAIENLGFAESVSFHATTRSPIEVCEQESYPIKVGYKISSFYSDSRETYIYNLNHYDTVIVVSDTNHNEERAILDLAKAVYLHNCHQVWYVKGENNV